jgi:phenol hydroxylase P2 protein
MSTVFIAFQTNDDTRPIIEAIMADNPHARLNEQPAMVKIDAEGAHRQARIDRGEARPPFDLQELQST